MKNTLIQKLEEMNNYTFTENNATAYKSTLNAVYDMFALGGAYRNRSDDDCILLFKKTFEKDSVLALKCLFYLRDIRGGQGERRFFRICFNWLANNYPKIAKKNISNISEYGRYDDLYCLIDTPLEEDMFNFIENQLKLDLKNLKEGKDTNISLLAKWIKSENTSSKESKQLAKKTRERLRFSHKAYRKMLSTLRTKINIVEKLMSENRWEEIQFDKIPSKAGLTYRNAFANRDVISEKYKEFILNKTTKVNARDLYPYEIVEQVTKKMGAGISETERATLQKYWDNQKDYLQGKKCKIMCVVDTSGSMTRAIESKTRPIDVAISLGMYCSERIGEPFENCFISFSNNPKFIKVEGVDFVDKVKRIYLQNLCQNTNLKAVFDLLKKCIVEDCVNPADMPDTIVVISDMEIDKISCWNSKAQAKTAIETIRAEWLKEGLNLPKLIFWNVDARNDIILDNNPNITLVSGCSPVIFESILSGKSGIQMMLEKLNSERYDQIK